MKTVEIVNYGPLLKGSFEPGNGYRYDVLAIALFGQFGAGSLGSVTDGTLIVDAFGGRAYLFSPNSVSDYVTVDYVVEKFRIDGEDAHAVAFVIATLLGRKTNSKYAAQTAEVEGA
jgi:hypothetical protein